MTLRTVRTIYFKELRETLRDRRTIVVMILLPLTLYPLVTVCFGSLAATQKRETKAQASRVCVTGAPEASRVEVALLAHGALLARADAPCNRKSLHDRALGAIVELPPDYDARLLSADPVRARVLYEEADEASRLAAHRATEALLGYADGRRRALLTERGLPGALVSRDVAEEKNLSAARDLGAMLLAQFMPVLVIFMVLLGAFYPALDLTAGERERGTLETLLVAPIERFEIIAGKWLAVATISTVTGLLNLGSMVLTAAQMLRLMSDKELPIAIPWTAIPVAGLAVIPVALFFSAILLAFASLARSYKEAQSVVAPIYLVISLPAFVAVVPGIELSVGMALVPGTGVALLVKAILEGRLPLGATVTAVLALFGYTGAALVLASRIYASEEVLWGSGEGGRMSARRGLKTLLGAGAGSGPEKAAPAPRMLSTGEAMTLYAIVVVLLFFVGMPLQHHNLVRGLLATQWALIFGATLLFLRVSGVRAGPALSLCRAPFRAWLAALLLGASIWVVVSALYQATLAKLFPGDKLVEQMLRTLMPEQNPRPLAFDLFLLALTPAVCEEVLCRGAILGALRGRLGPVGAAVISGVLFGLLHMHVLHAVPTALIGVVLGLLTLSAGSILPAMLLHFLNNGAGVLTARLHLEGWVDLGTNAGKITLAAAVVLFAGGLALLRPGRPANPRGTRTRSGRVPAAIKS